MDKISLQDAATLVLVGIGVASLLFTMVRYMLASATTPLWKKLEDLGKNITRLQAENDALEIENTELRDKMAAGKLALLKEIKAISEANAAARTTQEVAVTALKGEVNTRIKTVELEMRDYVPMSQYGEQYRELWTVVRGIEHGNLTDQIDSLKTEIMERKDPPPRRRKP